MEEVNSTESSGKLVWLIPLLILPLLAGAVVIGWFMLPARDSGPADNTPQTAKSAIPNLGSRGRPIETPPENERANSDPATDDGGTEDDGTEPEPEYANSEREIDIWLSNLAIATRSGDRRGIGLNHDMLAKARPDELVDQRVRAALDSEQTAIVRIQYWLAFHADEAANSWAMHVYDTRTAKFMGTDDQLAGGEVEELKLIAANLFDTLTRQWLDTEQGDARLMALLRNMLETERPAWLIDQAISRVILPMLESHAVSFARSIEQELRNLLLRRKAEHAIREYFFGAYMLTFDPLINILTELERSEWWDYASVLASGYGPRALIKTGAISPEWLEALLMNEETPKLFERLLQGSMPAEDKRLLIQRIAKFNVPNGRAMIETGLARKDANYPDYLTAFGSFASDDADLQRLTTAANDPDVPAAAGAIEGLRQSALNAADTELRKVLEQGLNLGVKSQALGAMLSRSANKSALLEEYLDPNKDASLRAVATAAIPLGDIARLQRVAEEDISPTVRLAALNRVGGITPADVRQRKELYGWFLKIKARDSSPIIRAAARKYAEATQD